MYLEQLKEIKNLILQNDNFVLLPHVRPDGDALGSSVALALSLAKMNKNVKILLNDKVPNNLTHLDNSCIVVESLDIESQWLTESYVAIAVDCSDITRFPAFEGVYNEAILRLAIDHHKTATPDADYYVVEPKAAATAEIIFDLIKEFEVKIDELIAIAIYTALATDTGNFTYSNVTTKTHQIASELYEIRDTFDDINNHIYSTDTVQKIKLHSEVLSRTNMFLRNRVAVASISQEQLMECGCEMQDSEGIVEKLRKIYTVEVAILLKEEEDKKIKVSMRSKNFVDVARIAQKFGGGGHTRAAGFSSELPRYDIVKMLVEDIKKQF